MSIFLVFKQMLHPGHEASIANFLACDFNHRVVLNSSVVYFFVNPDLFLPGSLLRPQKKRTSLDVPACHNLPWLELPVRNYINGKWGEAKEVGAVGGCCVMTWL